jgi:hypothetical protein
MTKESKGSDSSKTVASTRCFYKFKDGLIYTLKGLKYF